MPPGKRRNDTRSVGFGTNNNKIREKLINEGEMLTLDKAIHIAQSFE